MSGRYLSRRRYRVLANKDWQRDVGQIEIEDGVIRIHVLGEEDVQAFTDFGMDY